MFLNKVSSALLLSLFLYLNVGSCLGGKRTRRDAHKPKRLRIKTGSLTLQETTEQSMPINFNDGPKFRVKERPKCDSMGGDLGFCLNDPEYNETIRKQFQRIMQKAPINNAVSDVLNETLVPVEVTPSVRNRFGFTTEQTLCPSTETIIYPKRGQTANNDWVFILNQGSVQQGVRVEKCISPNTPCLLGGGPLENTSCRQKYIYKKLLAMDTSGNNIVSESVFLPSCCVCYVPSDFVATRSAGQSKIPRLRSNRNK